MESDAASRLSQISTAWTLLYRAHEGAGEDVKAARRQLLQDYSVPVYRYLRGAVDPDAADELYQEFALRFVQGGFKNADPRRGRFRDFLKTALYHLIVDHQRRQARRIRALPAQLEEPAAGQESESPSDQQFLAEWRRELLDRAWNALQKYQTETGQPFFTVLRLRADQPDLSSPQMAERLGPEWTNGNVRKRLHQAREKFTELLVHEVRQTLDTSDPDLLAEELQDLRLLDYCREVLPKPSS